MSERSTGRPSTPPPPLDITAVFPELRDLAATTIRLHPRKGEPGVRDSSLGGQLLWPADEPWPVCEEPHPPNESVLVPFEIRTWEQAGHWVATLGPGAQLNTSHVRFDGVPAWASLDRSEHQPYPMIGVLQVYARDVQDLPFPHGTDLFQLLWCPNNHDEPWYGPRPVAAWRRAASVTEPLIEPPQTTFDTPYNATCYLPAPCVLLPERVIEYPHPCDLPGILRDRLQAWDAGQEADRPYRRLLSAAPGTKLLGHPNWIQGPRWPICLCGRRMTHLVTIASAEYGDGDRWDDVPTGSSPHGIMIGDVGDMYLFTCTARNHRPLEGDVQFG
jgi:hypothetical protein